jgi:uncharacterized membrane protein YeaQ/YmgE (transglycosylase-associated protein family)
MNTVNICSFCLQLIWGAAAGYIAGAGLSALTWGTAGDLVLGVAGGGLGGRIQEYFLLGDTYASDSEIFRASITGACLGGALMVVIVGSVKAILQRR